MKKWKVKMLQFLTFWIQLYLFIKVAPATIKWFESVEWWFVLNTWLNSSLETKMIGIPVVIIGCLIFCILYIASFLYPQYLLENLESEE